MLSVQPNMGVFVGVFVSVSEYANVSACFWKAAAEVTSAPSL